MNFFQRAGLTLLLLNMGAIIDTHVQHKTANLANILFLCVGVGSFLAAQGDKE